MAATRTLSTAEERREEILTAAERVFAARGLHGTPTMEIAKAAGISQAYLFRLFPTKAELFSALVERCNARIERTFTDAAAAARAAGEPIMSAMGNAYIGLLGDRHLLLNQLHAHAASDDPAIRDQMRSGFRAPRGDRRARDRRERRGATHPSSPTGCCSTCSRRCRRRTSTRTGPRSCSDQAGPGLLLRASLFCLVVSRPIPTPQ